MKKKYSISLVTSAKTLILSFLALSFVALNSCGIMDAAANLQKYGLDGDSIPTVNSLVGKRSVTNVSVGTTYRQYTYLSRSVFEDLLQYTHFLRENDWTVSQSYNLEEALGSAQFAKASVDEGKILIMDIDYEEGKYNIKVAKSVGSLIFDE